MARTATTEEVAAALHVKPPTVRKYARESRIPFDTTPGGHRRYDLSEVAAAIGTSATRSAPTQNAMDDLLDEPLDMPLISVEPRLSTPITIIIDGDRRAPISRHGSDDENDVWSTVTDVV